MKEWMLCHIIVILTIFHFVIAGSFKDYKLFHLFLEVFAKPKSLMGEHSQDSMQISKIMQHFQLAVMGSVCGARTH